MTDKEQEKIEPEKMSIANKISLMELYREEWKYRDETFMSSFLKLSLLSLVITFFPDLTARIGFSSSSLLLTKIPKIAFSIAGCFCAVFGFLYSFSESKRIVKIDNAYYALMRDLPEKYQVERIRKANNDEEKKSANRKKSQGLTSFITSLRLNSVLYCLYLIPFLLAVVVLFF